MQQWAKQEFLSGYVILNRNEHPLNWTNVLEAS